MKFSRSMTSAAVGLLACAAPCAANPTAQVALQVTPQRSTQMETWVPDKVKAIVLFSTGHGSWPEKYDAIASAWKAAGFAVVAPVHVDSLHYPDREKFTREASFGERISDMKAASAYAARTWPGKPVIAAGHSFGTLTALCLGGGLANLGSFRNPTVTGDQDTVPGLVTDWHDHLLPLQGSPAGNKFAVTYHGADHELIGHPDNANYASAVSVSTDSLKAYGLRDRMAMTMLARSKTANGVVWLKR